jgi:uncharacterized membrane protein YtjA (UPF0391 family)
MRLFVLISLFLGFSAWSLTIAISHGPLGFLEVAGREPWAGQMLVDLGIALFVAWSWLRHDAKAKGIPAWPYIVGTVTLGSIGVLAYLVHREWVSRAARLATAS